MSPPQRRANLTALLIGLCASVAVIAAYLLGGLDWLELKTLDLRLRYANSIPEHPDIVCVDIDDEALDQGGRWPWPRDVQAGVVSILTELGAKAVLFDITLSEAEPLRSVADRHADLGPDLLTLGPDAAAIAFPDHELRTAIAAAGNVYLAFDYGSGAVLRSAGFRRVLEHVRRGELEQARRLTRESWPRPPGAPEPDRLLLWAQTVVTLEADPLAAAPVDISSPGPQARIEECRRLALHRWIRGWLDARPGRWNEPPQRLLQAIDRELIGPDEQQRARYWETLVQALRHVLSDQATARSGFLPLERVAAIARPVDEVSPVYFLPARAARRCGFVVFQPDIDGVMRWVQLLVQHEGRVLPQLALAVGFDALGLTAEDVTAAPGRLTLRRAGPDPPLVIQLDEDGRALVPWVAERDWTRQFGQHVPVGAIWQVVDRRFSVAHNRAEVLTKLGTLLRAGRLGDYQQYHDDLKRRLELDSELRLARYRDDAETAADMKGWISQYDKLLAEDEPRLRADLARQTSRVSSSTGPADDGQLRTYLRALQEIERAFAANDVYRAEIETTLRRLRNRVEGRICSVGYTATSLADMTPIPTHPRAAGVMAHANLLNGLLTGRMVSWTPAWLNALLAALCGAAVSLVSVWRRPRAAALIVAVLVVILVAVAGWWTFHRYTHWIALTPALGTMLASYFMIAVYRYMFVERERRQLTTALTQYTSPTLARKMAEDAELCRRAETREVTAMFTDLRGFTSISERIGAERTQRVLNLCLGRCSEVMLRYEAMINKFIGDGIFAFWNPVIYPQPDHAHQACETAVELQIALRKLAAEQREQGGDEVFGELVLRVGLATGPAVVGPCGSEQKYDYTCIGDTVNVAARLESGNKFYGTRTLVSGATRQQVGEHFAFRSLGGVRVKGKREAVPIYELLGRAEQVSEESRDYARDFGRAVVLFRDRQWPAAAAAFAACRQKRPDDLAAERYAQTIAEFTTRPPPEDWTGAIELTEK